MFKGDPEVMVVYDEDNRDIKLYVENSKKASALEKILPKEKKFGRIIQRISVIPANGLCSVEKEELFKAALEGNNAVSFIRSVEGIFANSMTFVVFKKEVVQFWTDNIGDYFGLRSTLYQNIAEEIFENTDGVYFSTDETDDYGYEGERFGAPLGEWP